jgi:hypothetical protein
MIDLTQFVLDAETITRCLRIERRNAFLLREAINKIESLSCPMGTDYGNSEIYKICQETLAKTEPIQR